MSAGADARPDTNRRVLLMSPFFFDVGGTLYSYRKLRAATAAAASSAIVLRRWEYT